jgi:hypothetical protein
MAAMRRAGATTAILVQGRNNANSKTTTPCRASFDPVSDRSYLFLAVEVRRGGRERLKRTALPDVLKIEGTIMKKVLLTLAMLGMLGFSSAAMAGVHVSFGVGVGPGYYGPAPYPYYGYYGNPYPPYYYYGGPSIYFGPGYYPWHHGYWHGGYYRGYHGYHGGYHGAYSHH